MPSDITDYIEADFASINKDTALRALLFGMVFYILSSPIVSMNIAKYVPMRLEGHLIGAVLFACIFYIISISI